MKNTELRYVTQERAAALQGIPKKELSRISEESGLGHKERAGKRFFSRTKSCGGFAKWRLTFTSKNEFPSGPPQMHPRPGSLTPSDSGFFF